MKPLRKKMVVKITMWTLIVTFVLWGAASVTMTSRNYVGIVFGKRISPQEYNRSYSAVFNRAKMMYGDNLSKIQKFLNLNQQAWDRLTLLLYAKKQRIKATNQEVIAKIVQMPFFQSGGAFDQRAYAYILQNVFGAMAHDFEESVRGDIIISKLIASAEKDVSVTEKELEETYRTKFEKADISYILIKPESFTKDVAIEEKELEPFYNAHKQQLLSPERINVYYVKIPAPEKEKDNAKKLAQEINDYLNLGDDFNALAKKHNLTISETGPFSFTEPVPGIGLSYPFSIGAFSLAQEKTNNIVEEKDCFYVIKLKEKIPAYTPPFDEVKEAVRLAITIYKADSLAKAASNNYITLLKTNKDSLENLSQALKAELKTLKDMTREGYINGVGFNADFNSACFSVKEKESAGPIKVQKGYAIIRLDALKPPDKAAFEKEKEELKNKLTEEKRMKFFEGWMDTIKKKANLKILNPNI